MDSDGLPSTDTKDKTGKRLPPSTETADSVTQLRKVIDSALDAVIMIDENSVITDWSAQAEKLFGWSRREILGRTLTATIIPERYRTNHTKGMQHFLVTGEGPVINRRIEITATRRTGEEFPVELTVCPLKHATGWTFSAFIRDISTRVKADEECRALEAQLLHSQKLESLGVMAGGIAHDFNNLLMGIVGNADLALLDLPPESTCREEIKDILHAAQHLAELCKQLLAYSGKGVFVIEPTDLTGLVTDITHLLELSISKKAQLVYKLADDLPTVEVDRTQIRQILVNLIVNASEALDDHTGLITLTTGLRDCDREYLATPALGGELPPGQYVLLTVSDSGRGMDDDTVRRMFDPFFSTKFSGRGLGMAAVLGIVRSHRGTIKIDSKRGHGTTISVLLPPSTLPTNDPQDTATTSPSPRTKTRTILLADDEPSVLRTTRKMLERQGFHVVTATDGQEVLDRFEALGGTVDLVILDMTMPTLSGEETLRALQQIAPDVPIVLSSGYNEQDAVRGMLGRSPSGFIQKPYGVDDLIRVLRKNFPETTGS